MKKGTIHIGTSGWKYKHWKGTYYPPGLKDDDEFNFYSKQFSTVEINSSFYHLPDKKTFTNWKKQAPDNFIFAVKASRYITHMKKLIPDPGSIRLLTSHAAKLGEKLGPILFQLPPGWKINVERLAAFLARLPKKHRYTFEFRNATWYAPAVHDLLRKYNCAFCIYNLEKHLSPLEVTADFVYVRLHGPGNKYQGSYSKETLADWRNRSIEWLDAGKDVFIYFDNDQEGYAAFNARVLIELMQHKKPGRRRPAMAR